MAGPTMKEQMATFTLDPLRVIVAHLAKNTIDPAYPDLALADLVECDFPGYAAVQIDTWHPEMDNEDDLACCKSDLISFQTGNVLVPQRATIFYVTKVYDGGAPELFHLEYLDEGKVIFRAGQTIDRIFRLTFADIFN